MAVFRRIEGSRELRGAYKKRFYLSGTYKSPLSRVMAKIPPGEFVPGYGAKDVIEFLINYTFSH